VTRRPLIDPDDEPILRWAVGGIIIAIFIPGCLCGILLDRWPLHVFAPLIMIGGASLTLASAGRLFRKALSSAEGRATRIVVAVFLFNFVVFVIAFLLLWLTNWEPARR
jgi:hypothetical protein